MRKSGWLSSNNSLKRSTFSHPHHSTFSKRSLVIFILIFAAIGGYIILKSFAAPNPNLPGDLNNDNSVNITDLSILLSNYGSTTTTALSTADINSDGTVNILDLSILLSHYGQVYTQQPLTQSTSLANSATISGTYAWNVSTNIAESQVEYFVENTSLGKVSGSTSFTYSLDTTKYPDGIHNGGYWIYDSSGTSVYKSPSINFTVSNGTGGGTGSILEFGNFAGGFNSDIADTSFNCGNNHVTMNPVGSGPNGGNYERLVADDSMTFPNQGALVRIHCIGFKSGNPSWFKNGNTIWEAVSERVPAGYTNTYTPTVMELHGDNGTGPAPLNQTFTRGGNWTWIIRGSKYTVLNDPQGFKFASNDFGQPDQTGTYDGQYYRHNLGFTGVNGGTLPVTLGQWVHWRAGWHLDPDESSATTTGWFELWMRTDSMTQWVNVVPRHTGIPTSYLDFTGDGFGIAAPYVSLYYNVGGGGQNAIDVAAGAFSNDYTTLVNWQNNRLGF